MKIPRQELYGTVQTKAENLCLHTLMMKRNVGIVE
jgi:hypothetical protein